MSYRDSKGRFIPRVMKAQEVLNKNFFLIFLLEN